MNETSIARQSVPDQVARAILDFLKRNGYEPGDKIPTTKAMCEHFEVGYPTLREAIQQLETLGFVRVRHGSGIYVESLEERLFVANPMEVKPAGMRGNVLSRRNPGRPDIVIGFSIEQHVCQADA